MVADMLRTLGFVALVSALTSGCAGTAPSAGTPSISPSIPASISPSPHVAVADSLETAPDLRSARLPEAAPCEIDSEERCPADILHAAAMSWLGKTTAEYDGLEMKIVEHDFAEVQAEARADAAFAELLLAADVAPRDGELDGAESSAVEERVLALVAPTSAT